MAARDSTLPPECKPVLTVGGTDSTSLDEAVELISQNGRTVAEALRMLLPPAVNARRKSAFLEYHADCVEPWDGPAAIAFSDGLLVGAALDRNGLRPSRFAMTEDGLVIAGSEAGLIDLDPEKVIESGRLGPGQMLVVDLAAGKVYRDEELLALFDAGATYARQLEVHDFAPEDPGGSMPAIELMERQRAFGYTREDVKMILQPMGAEGKDAVWSMGDDTPLAFLAHSPRPVYAFFRQTVCTGDESGDRPVCARRWWSHCIRGWVRGRTCWIRMRRCRGCRSARRIYLWRGWRRFGVNSILMRRSFGLRSWRACSTVRRRWLRLWMRYACRP